MPKPPRTTSVDDPNASGVGGSPTHTPNPLFTSAPQGWSASHRLSLARATALMPATLRGQRLSVAVSKGSIAGFSAHELPFAPVTPDVSDLGSPKVEVAHFKEAIAKILSEAGAPVHYTSPSLTVAERDTEIRDVVKTLTPEVLQQIAVSAITFSASASVGTDFALSRKQSDVTDGSSRSPTQHTLFPAPTGGVLTAPASRKNSADNPHPLNMWPSVEADQRLSISSTIPSVRPQGGTGPAAFRRTSVAQTMQDADGTSQLNQYLLLEELGHGAQSVVWLGFDTVQNEFRAIKEVRRPMDNSSEMAQIRREIAIMKQLRHRNVITLHEIIDDPKVSRLYLVLQYAERGALVKYTDPNTMRCEPLEPSFVLHVAKQAVAGLNYLHENQILHRDIKPDNILRGKDDLIFLADFGVAQVVADFEGSSASANLSNSSQADGIAVLDVDGSNPDSAQSSVSSIAESEHSTASAAVRRRQQGGFMTAKGTPAFFSPEVFAAKDERSFDEGRAADLWALGVTFYVLLFGQLPWSLPSAPLPTDAENVASPLMKFREAVVGEELRFPAGSKVPVVWRNLLLRMLDKDITKRLSLETIRATLRAIKVVDLQPPAVSASSPVVVVVPTAAAAVPSIPPVAPPRIPSPQRLRFTVSQYGAASVTGGLDSASSQPATPTERQWMTPLEMDSIFTPAVWLDGAVALPGGGGAATSSSHNVSPTRSITKVPSFADSLTHANPSSADNSSGSHSHSETSQHGSHTCSAGPHTPANPLPETPQHSSHSH